MKTLILILITVLSACNNKSLNINGLINDPNEEHKSKVDSIISTMPKSSFDPTISDIKNRKYCKVVEGYRSDYKVTNEIIDGHEYIVICNYNAITMSHNLNCPKCCISCQ